jgi:hypothetical protein
VDGKRADTAMHGVLVRRCGEIIKSPGDARDERIYCDSSGNHEGFLAMGLPRVRLWA